MGEARAYSTRQFVIAVCVAALLGWAAVISPLLLVGLQTWNDQGGAFGRTLGYLAATAMVGIPIALVACWAVAAPILWRVMRSPIGWRRAALWGTVIPGAMAIVGVIVQRLRGLQVHADPNFYFETGGRDNVQEIDGILTPLGWWVTLQNSLIFIALGFAVALIVRAIIGPGKSAADATAGDS